MEMADLKSIPIIKLDENLIVSIQVSLHDRLVMKLQDDISNQIVKTKAKGLIVDVSSVEIMDSFIARTINDIGKNAKTMGTEAVLVGLRPAVAITLIEMGMELDSVHTALNLEGGIQKVKEINSEDNDLDVNM
jgi:rsbT antagonist protein RsbS